MKLDKYLLSDDIEMVQLGVNMMKNLPLIERISHLTNLNRRFSYDIVGDDIYIRRKIGIYEQLSDKNSHIYDKNQFSLRTFEEVINNYLNQKDENQQWNV